MTLQKILSTLLILSALGFVSAPVLASKSILKFSNTTSTGSSTDFLYLNCNYKFTSGSSGSITRLAASPGQSPENQFIYASQGGAQTYELKCQVMDPTAIPAKTVDCTNDGTSKVYLCTSPSKNCVTSKYLDGYTIWIHGENDGGNLHCKIEVAGTP